MYQAFASDAAPTIALVHKGEPAFESYRDLLALAELAPVFGQFTNLSRYFTDATSGDYIGVQSADEFFCDYLDDRVTHHKRPDPVSGFPQQLRLRRRLDAAYTLAGLHRAVTPNPGTDEEKLARANWKGSNATWNCTASTSPIRRILPSDSSPLEAAWAKKLAERLQTRAAEGQPGLLVFNPCGFTRRIVLELPGYGGPDPGGRSHQGGGVRGRLARLVVEIPSLGYAWIPRPGQSRRARAEGTAQAGEQPHGAERVLRVRHRCAPAAASVRSATCAPGAPASASNSSTTPAAAWSQETVEVTNSGTALGEIIIHRRLCWAITTTCWRRFGSASGPGSAGRCWKFASNSM